MSEGLALQLQQIGPLTFSRVVVTTTNEDPQTALEKLHRGEIAAVTLVAGKPAPLFSELIDEDGLFLAIPQDLEAIDSCVAARLTAADYPGLVPYIRAVDTLAVGTVLAAANLQVGSDRYRMSSILSRRSLPTSSHYSNLAIIPSSARSTS